MTPPAASHDMPKLSLSLPLVSCIMPTADRRCFVPQAIRYFLRQDYPNKELVILDDGADAVADLVPADPQIRYERLVGRRTLGVKRNACVEACHGDLILHWDDDDWMAAWRIRYQVEQLLAAGAEVCGVRRMFFYEFASGAAWLYSYPERGRAWLAGGSLLYTRAFWQRSPFPDVQVGSDTRFIWSQPLKRALALPEHGFYVAMIHPRNTSRKACRGAYWSRWTGDLSEVMGEDLQFYRSLATARSVPELGSNAEGAEARMERSGGERASGREPGTLATRSSQPAVREYSILMAVHNALPVVQIATTRTLRHSAGQDARLVVVDNASDDGAGQWLELLAQRGDIDLIRSEKNLGHGPALELARRATQSPYLVTLDSDAFPLVDDWLPRLRARLGDAVKVAGIRHHRDYIHPSCLLIARATLDEFDLSFLAEKDRPDRFDVAERISHEIKRRGLQIAGLERTDALRRGGASEPVYLGSNYEGTIYHQWYTTRAATAGGRAVDDVPNAAIERSLAEMIAGYHAEARPLTVVMGLQVAPDEPQRLRNAIAALQALNLQDLPRWQYRIVLVEQGREARAERDVAPFVDRYLFAYNPGPYNRGWGFNVGAALPASRAGVLCLIDADVLAPPAFLRLGLAQMEGGHHALQPYSEVLYLDAASSEQAVRDRLAAPLGALDVQRYRGELYTTAQGGCIWVNAQLYQEIGGHNEDFRGWGQEDREFWRRLAQATPIPQLPGRLLHLDHPRPAMNDRWARENRLLYRRLSAGMGAEMGQPTGDPDRYRKAQTNRVAARSAGRPSSQPAAVGRRAWENWHRWRPDRLDRIVQNELRQGETSARSQLAEIATGLGDTLLDVGCGPGALWPHFERHRPRFAWAGADATEAMVATARRLFSDVPVYHADAGELPFAEDSFDVVLLRHVLEHLPEWLMAQALSEATRVARRAVVVDFFVPPDDGNVRHTAQVGENFLETRWGVAEVEAPIQQAGWQVEKRFPLVGSTKETDEVWILRPGEAASPHAARQGGEEPAEPFKFSIIMPTFRRRHTLARTVRTIQLQTYRTWELIIVDNAGDVDCRFDDRRIRLYRHAEQRSASYARNKGLEYATGDLVCFFDDDDDMFPDYLATFAAAFRDHPSAKLVRCGMLVSGGQTNFSYATPECCLRAGFAAPLWSNRGPGQDQRYFRQIIARHGWSEARGDIVSVPRALCRANADPRGGLRSGRY